MQLGLGGASPLRRLVLEGAEQSQLTLSLDDPLHRGDAKGANQLVFEVGDAHVETEGLHRVAGESGAEAGPLEAAAEVALLGLVAEAGQGDIAAMRAKHLQEVSDGRRAA